jgi:hypothetical protein
MNFSNGSSVLNCGWFARACFRTASNGEEGEEGEGEAEESCRKASAASYGAVGAPEVY